MKILIVAIVYVAVSVGNFGFMNATWKYDYPSHCSDSHQLRRDYTFNAAFAAVPFAGTAIAVLNSGFGQDGWNLNLTCDR